MNSSKNQIFGSISTKTAWLFLPFSKGYSQEINIHPFSPYYILFSSKFFFSEGKLAEVCITICFIYFQHNTKGNIKNYKIERITYQLKGNCDTLHEPYNHLESEIIISFNLLLTYQTLQNLIRRTVKVNPKVKLKLFSNIQKMITEHSNVQLIV